MSVMIQQRGFEPKAPFAPQMFGNGGREHMEKVIKLIKVFILIIISLSMEQLKNNLPRSHIRIINIRLIIHILNLGDNIIIFVVYVYLYIVFRDEYSLADILSSPTVYEPLTKLQCCPTSDGSAAAIVCSEDFVKKHKLQSKVSKFNS